MLDDVWDEIWDEAVEKAGFVYEDMHHRQAHNIVVKYIPTVHLKNVIADDPLLWDEHWAEVAKKELEHRVISKILLEE